MSRTCEYAPAPESVVEHSNSAISARMESMEGWEMRRFISLTTGIVHRSDFGPPDDSIVNRRRQPKNGISKQNLFLDLLRAQEWPTSLPAAAR